MRQLARARLSSLRRAKASLQPYWSHRSSLPRPKRFARRRHRPTPMAIDTLPLDAHCIIVSPEPMDIDQWEVNVALQPDEAAMLACVVAMGGEADVLPVHGGWSGTRVPSFPSPIPMVVDQLHTSSSPSPTQLAPTNPTMEDGNIFDRVPFAPSPTRMVAEQVSPSPPTPHFALPAPTMLGGVSPTPSSSPPATPSPEGMSRAGSEDPAEDPQQTPEVPAADLSDYEADDEEPAPEEADQQESEADDDDDEELPSGWAVLQAEQFFARFAIEHPDLVPVLADPDAPIPGTEAFEREGSVSSSAEELLSQDGVDSDPNEPLSDGGESGVEEEPDNEFDEFAAGVGSLSLG